MVHKFSGGSLTLWFEVLRGGMVIWVIWMDELAGSYVGSGLRWSGGGQSVRALLRSGPLVGMALIFGGWTRPEA